MDPIVGVALIILASGAAGIAVLYVLKKWIFDPMLEKMNDW